MSITDNAKAYHEKMFPGQQSALAQTDPEFIERFDNFAFDEVVNQGDLDDRTRMMAILATLLGCQGIDEFKVMLPAALNLGVTPVEAKEIVYQAAAYLGIGRVYPFLNATNEVLTARGVKLPLEGQATTTMETRLQDGEQTQVDIFGDHMRGFSQSAEGRLRNRRGQILQKLDMFHGSPAFDDIRQKLQHPLGALAAGNALSAGFVLREVHKESGYFHHAALVVHDHQSAGADHRAYFF